ncbi:MAG: hypothetical protein ACF8PG_14975 [Maioricimonas sp. JB045]
MRFAPFSTRNARLFSGVVRHRDTVRVLAGSSLSTAAKHFPMTPRWRMRGIAQL